MLFNKVRDRIARNKELKSKGEWLGIPYPFPRLNEYLGSIDRGQVIGMLAGTGVGKSKLMRYIFVYNIYKFYKETGYKVRVLYFCMEDAKDSVYDYIICNYLKEYHNIIVSRKELNSKGRELPQFVMDKINEATEFFADFEKIVTLIDGITEPTELYKTCEKIALKMGKVIKWKESVEGEEVTQYRYDSDTHVIALFDNQSNIDTEDGTSNESQAILRFAKEYARLKLANFFQWTVVIILQMDFDSEKQAYSKTGELLTSKIEPGLHSIGDSKRASRAMHLIFSLLDPDRYDLIKWPLPSKRNPDMYYDIDILGNKFRSLKVIKSNDTDYKMRVGLLFDGICETFEELPQPGTPELERVYTKIKNKGQFTKVNNGPDKPMPF